MRFRFLPALVFVATVLLLSTPSRAQDEAHGPPESGAVGVGVLLGQPTGITAKIHTENRAYDGAIAWEINQSVFVQGHALVVRGPLPPEPAITYFAGPGASIAAGDNQVELGLSVNGGLAYYLPGWEIFVQLTPRVEIVPSTEPNLGLGLGFRYYPSSR